MLEDQYQSADLGNLSDPLAELVYIVLSRQTREAVYQQVFSDLRARWPEWVALRCADEGDLIAVLRPAGFQEQRARQLLAVLDEVDAENCDRCIGPYATPAGDLTLDFLASLDDVDCEQFLLRLPGVGPKSARCVMGYSLDRASFAVDTHVARVLSRLDLITNTKSKIDHGVFEALVPAARRVRLHVNLVHHGRNVCRSQRPRCNDCVLRSICPSSS